MRPDALARLSLQTRRRGVQRRRALYGTDPFVWAPRVRAFNVILTRTDRYFMPSLNWHILRGVPIDRCELLDSEGYIVVGWILLHETVNYVRPLRDVLAHEDDEPVDDVHYVLEKATSNKRSVQCVWITTSTVYGSTSNIEHIDVPDVSNKYATAR